MAATPKYLFANMSTVFTFPLDGVNLKDPKQLEKIDRVVEGKVKAIIDKLKATHQKFEDADFGPTEDDEFGSKSLYGNAPPAPSGSKYPSPESLRWDRPHYDDDKFALVESAKVAKSSGDDDEEGDGEGGGEEDEGNDDFDDEFGSSSGRGGG